MSTPLICKLKETYPKAEITYLTTPVGASVLRNNPHLSHIIEYDKRGEHKGIKGLWLIAKKLKMEAFNMVITPHRYMRSSILSWLTGAPVRKGYKNATGAFFYNQKVEYDTDKHEVEKLLSFVSKDTRKRYEIELYPSEMEKQRVGELLKNIDKEIVVIAPGSKWFTKRWPLEYFNIVIDKLSKDNRYTIVLIGGKEEKEYSIRIGKNVVDLRGKTSLLESAEVIRRSKCILTNDSSPIHMASAFPEVKIIAIFGPTVKRFGFFPWSKNNIIFENNNIDCRPCSIHGGDKCPKKHFRCMRDIKPKDILKYLENL